MTEKWDDIFSAAQNPSSAKQEEAETPVSAPPPKAKSKSKPAKQPRQPKPAVKATPWGDLEPEAKEATVRLNVDIPISLNDRLAEKARQLRKPKTELVRRLLEWALNDSEA